MCYTPSCICSTSSWAKAVAQCIGSQCGAASVTDFVDTAYPTCESLGYGPSVPSAELISIGLAAVSSSSSAVASVPQTIVVQQSVGKTSIIFVSAELGSIRLCMTTLTIIVLETASTTEVVQTAITSSSTTISFLETVVSQSLFTTNVLASSPAPSISSTSPTSTPDSSGGLSYADKVNITVSVVMGVAGIVAAVLIAKCKPWKRCQRKPKDNQTTIH